MWAGQWDVRRFAVIDSTNTYLKAQARRGAPDGTVAVADHQTAGRGRLDRTWEAPPGASLLFSVLMRPQLDLNHLYLSTAAVALAAADACVAVAAVEPQVKWPNDLLVGDAKLAGVLAEADVAGRAVRSVVVGVGVNLAWPGPPGVGGTCLDEVSPNAPVSRDALLEALLAALEPRRGLLDEPEGRLAVAAELRRRCATIGRTVSVELPGEALTGLATGVDHAGHLLVETQGATRVVAAGDVVHLRPA